jgi:hypothetical protein
VRLARIPAASRAEPASLGRSLRKSRWKSSSSADARLRVSTLSQPERRADQIAGFLCACSLALSGVALVTRPGVLATAAIVVALVAVRMAEAQARRRLAAIAVFVGAFAFLAGMTIAIWADTPLY